MSAFFNVHSCYFVKLFKLVNFLINLNCKTRNILLIFHLVTHTIHIPIQSFIFLRVTELCFFIFSVVNLGDWTSFLSWSSSTSRYDFVVRLSLLFVAVKTGRKSCSWYTYVFVLFSLLISRTNCANSPLILPLTTSTGLSKFQQCRNKLSFCFS